MKNFLFIIIFLLAQNILYSQDITEDDFFYYGISEGITIYGNQDNIENKIIESLNKGQKERKAFIQDELLTNSGFSKNANSKIRKTTAGEKTLSVFQGIFHLFTLGLIPLESFKEVEYDKLINGEFYNFYAVLLKSDLANVSLEIQKIMELEYKLQIEFLNGVLIERKNLKYYTEENIEKFEQLILSLPDDIDDIKPIKERFLIIELPKIKSALHRYLNPSELDIQTRENLKTYKFKM